MNEALTRRGFVHGGILVTVTTAGSTIAWSREFFCSPEGGEALCKLVLDNLDLKPSCAPVVRRFVSALQFGELEQTESSEFVQGLIATTAQGEAALGRYVVGEFVARTNYFEYSAGLDPDLKVLSSSEFLPAV